MKLKLTTFFVSLVLALALFPTVVQAQSTVSVGYIDATGVQQTPVNATVVESSTTTWNTGWYVVQNDVTVDSRVIVNGDVNLILADGYTLDAADRTGINVTSGNSLTIWGQNNGTGRLEAFGGNYDAGIGSEGFSNDVVGTITINGGTINAYGSMFAAGIGSGFMGNNGVVIINGGTVNAYGNMGGAGIGGSNGNDVGGACGSITINGGNITAIGQYGAGIGSGLNSAGTGDITINGGNITAFGDNCDDVGAGERGHACTVVINGGSIDGRVSSPKNDNGADVYLNTLLLGNAANAGNVITAGSINNVDCAETPDASTGVYGIKDVRISGGGMVYFWLPVSSGSEMVKLTANGNEYKKAYSHTATDNTDFAILTLPITVNVEQEGGASGTTSSTGIKLEFSVAVSGLTGNDITLTDGTGVAIKGSSVVQTDSYGKEWTLALDGVITEGDITVTIADFWGYTVMNSPIYNVEVYKDVTAPTLTPGTISRTSDTEATVKFTSDKEGRYYYQLDGTAPSSANELVTAGGRRFYMTAAEQTIRLAYLSTLGEHKLYIAAIDREDNVSNLLTLTIPAFPVLNQPQNQTVSPGTNTADVNFSGDDVDATKCTWTNNDIAIGLGASGTGNILAFNATNATNAPITATITVTPVSNIGVTGNTKTFTITVLGNVNNSGGSATETYSRGLTIDLSGVSGLLTIDSNAGTAAYSLETGESGYTGEGSLSGTILTVTKAGVFKIGLVTEATGTHAEGAKVIATLTVNKATPNITWPVATGINYGATLSTSNLLGGSGDGGGAFDWATGSIIPTVSNSGYEVRFTPNDVANYDYSSIALTHTTAISVSPKDITGATVTVNGVYIYNGYPHTPSAADVRVTLGGFGTLTTGSDYTYTVTGDATNIGSVILIVTGQGNFKGTATGTFTIDKNTHKIHVGTFAGGSVSASKDSAEPGETVILTIQTYEGYRFYDIEVYKTGDEATTVETRRDESSQTYTFTMPDYDVTVSPMFLSFDQVAVNEAVEQINFASLSDVFIVSQKTANTQATVRNWLAEKINTMIAPTGAKVSASNILFHVFTAAKSGTFDKVAGINGSFRFYVTLTKGDASVVVTGLTGIITALRYVPTGIDDVPQTQRLKAYIREGMLHVSGLTSGEIWRVYSISGALIYSKVANSAEASVGLPARGVYVVKSRTGVVKVKN